MLQTQGCHCFLCRMNQFHQSHVLSVMYLALLGAKYSTDMAEKTNDLQCEMVTMGEWKKCGVKEARWAEPLPCWMGSGSTKGPKNTQLREQPLQRRSSRKGGSRKDVKESGLGMLGFGVPEQLVLSDRIESLPVLRPLDSQGYRWGVFEQRSVHVFCCP